MASIKFGNNLNYQGESPNFDRDAFATIEDMKNFEENWLPDVFIAVCYEDGNVYVFNRNNDFDDVTGRWRMLGGALQEEITAAYNVGGVKEGAVLEAGKSLEDIVRTMLVGDKEIGIPAYYGVAADKITDLSALTEVQPASNFTIEVTAHNEYVIIACPATETNVQIFSNGFDYTSSFKTLVDGDYKFFYSETKITCTNFNYTITYN